MKKSRRLRRAAVSRSILYFLCLVLALDGCALFRPKHRKDKPQENKNKKAELHEENDEVDFHGFVGRLRKAVAAHDLNTIASMMASDFGYSLSPEKTGEGVFQYWDENNLWPELEGILSEKFVKKGDFWVAPPQFADESLNYDGYRAGIHRVNGSWKFVYFVNG